MPSAATRLLLKMLNYASRSGYTYQFRDEFTTQASAPLSSPRTAEPGPGTLTLVQTDGQLSVNASNQLVLPAQSTPAWGDQGAYSATLARLAGRTFFYQVRHAINPASFGGLVGIGAGTGASYTNLISGHSSVWMDNTALYVLSSAFSNLAVGATLVSGTNYQIALQMEATGVKAFIKGGSIYTAWTMLFRSLVGTAGGGVIVGNCDNSITMDYIRVRDLAVFAPTLSVSSPVNAQSYTGEADAEVDMTLTSAGTILTSGGFKFRYQDADNYWIAYFSTAGAFRVDSVTATVVTNQINVAGVIGTSATRTIRAKFRDNKLFFYTLSGTTWTQRGTVLTNSSFLTATTIVPDFGADWTATNLVDDPLSSAAYTAALDAG